MYNVSTDGDVEDVAGEEVLPKRLAVEGKEGNLDIAVLALKEVLREGEGGEGWQCGIGIVIGGWLGGGGGGE